MDIGHSTGPIVAGALIGAYTYRLAFGVIGGGLVVVSLVFGFLMRSLTNRGSKKVNQDT
jgi:hypothetical protein